MTKKTVFQKVYVIFSIGIFSVLMARFLMETQLVLLSNFTLRPLIYFYLTNFFCAKSTKIDFCVGTMYKYSLGVHQNDQKFDSLDNCISKKKLIN